MRKFAELALDYLILPTGDIQTLGGGLSGGGTINGTLTVTGNIVSLGTLNLNALFLGSFSDTSGTPGNANIGYAQAGLCAVAAAASSVVLTRGASFAANTTVLCCIQTNDATAIFKNATISGTLLTITFTAAATGNTNVFWWTMTH